MTTKQIKSKINQALDKVPENLLSEVLDYINELNQASDAQSVKLSRLKRLLNDDSDLMERLAK